LKPTNRTLKKYLARAISDLNRGEKVKVDFSGQLHSRYLDYKMDGLYSDLLCIKENNEYYLARIR